MIQPWHDPSGHVDYLYTEHIWNPMDLVDTSNYSIYVSLVNRIDALYGLLAKIRRHGPLVTSQVKTILMKWIDTHIPLAVYMETKEEYEDSYFSGEIYDLLRPRDSLGKSRIESFSFF